MIFLGIDLGWIRQPSGVARLDLAGDRLTVSAISRCHSHQDVLAWIDEQAGTEPAMVAVDAPLVVTNEKGARDCEREISREFARRHAGCHSSNKGSRFYSDLIDFTAALDGRGFRHAADLEPGAPGRWMIEVYPHAAAVSVFRLDRIIKYKRGRVADRARELSRFQKLLGGIVAGDLPSIPSRGESLKPVEDMLDAVFAAWIGAHWWRHGSARGRCYGTAETGYIVVPAHE